MTIPSRSCSRRVCPRVSPQTRREFASSAFFDLSASPSTGLRTDTTYRP